MLGRFQGQIDLYQHLNRPAGRRGRLIDPLQQIHAVYGVDVVEHPGFPGLVRLQMADEVPADAPPGPLDLLQRLLDLVLAEILLTSVSRRTNGVDGLGLRDGDQPDVAGWPARARRGFCHARPDFG